MAQMVITISLGAPEAREADVFMNASLKNSDTCQSKGHFNFSPVFKEIIQDD